MVPLIGRTSRPGFFHGGRPTCFCCRRPAPLFARAQGRFLQVTRAVATVVPGPTPDGFDAWESPHPDAARRRREAKAREVERKRELAEISAQISGRSTDQPPNIVNIDCVSEFDFRVSCGSRNGRKVLAHFKSPSCQSCVRLQFKLKRAARENPDILFLLVDVSEDSLGEMCRNCGIEKIPYFYMYESGVLVSKGLWGEIDILRKSSKIDIDEPLCTLSKPGPDGSHSGRWKRVRKSESEGRESESGMGLMKGKGKEGNGVMELLVHSSVLEWVPLEEDKK